MLNKHEIIGRLGSDPEVRYTNSGSQVTNISVATSEQWRDKDTGEKKEKTEWHRVVFFGKLAEIAGEYLRKGSLVYIEGKSETNKWQDNDGNDRYTTQLVAREMKMLGSRGDSGESSGNSQPRNEGGFRDKPQEVPAGATEDPDDDIPF